MATEVDRRFHPDEPRIEADSTLASPGPARGKVAALVIATRNEIAAAGIEALLQRNGYSVVARCSSEDDLLRSSQAYHPDIIVLAENMVRQEAARMVLRLRAHNRSVAIIFLLEEGDAIKPADLLALDVRGILLSAACARAFIDCVESVHHGRSWVDPDLLRHLTVADRPPQTASGLTSREAEIARLVSRGLHNKEIARELHLSEGTVKMHLHHVYEKLQLAGRMQLALSITGERARMPASSNGDRLYIHRSLSNDSPTTIRG
jgi:two-component system nitrate/nitrite response regulator NarL